jgi:Lipocalin-like domain
VFLVLTERRASLQRPARNMPNYFATLIAYTGTYRVEGDKWTTKVDVAWIPEWVGTEQTRSLTVDGDRLQVLSPWRVNTNWPDKGMTRSIRVAFHDRRAEPSLIPRHAQRQRHRLGLEAPGRVGWLCLAGGEQGKCHVNGRALS